VCDGPPVEIAKQTASGSPVSRRDIPIEARPDTFDLLVDDCLLVELMAVQDVVPIHKGQLLSYMKLLNVPQGLLFNFHEVKLVDGISRLLLPGGNHP
jgi:GxxExxY protein